MDLGGSRHVTGDARQRLPIQVCCWPPQGSALPFPCKRRALWAAPPTPALTAQRPHHILLRSCLLRLLEQLLRVQLFEALGRLFGFYWGVRIKVVTGNGQAAKGAAQTWSEKDKTRN